MKILYIDDSPMQIKIVGIYLSKNGQFEFLTATNGKEGIAKARVEEPDVILLDMEMPEMNGEDALRILKSDMLTSNIPVIVFTSSSETWLEERILSLGAEAFLKKPHGISTLTNTINRILLSKGSSLAQ